MSNRYSHNSRLKRIQARTARMLQLQSQVRSKGPAGDAEAEISELSRVLRESVKEYPVESRALRQLGSYDFSIVDRDGKSVPFDYWCHHEGRIKGLVALASEDDNHILKASGWSMQLEMLFAAIWYNDAKISNARGDLFLCRGGTVLTRYEPREVHSGCPLTNLGFYTYDVEQNQVPTFSADGKWDGGWRDEQPGDKRVTVLNPDWNLEVKNATRH